VDIHTIWETITDNVKIPDKESVGYYELKKQTPWFDKGCSKLLNPGEKAKLQ
jgi:hypothetical protein